MKPLISITLLFFSVSGTLSLGAQDNWTADAQKLADFARQERSRQSLRPRAVAVYTSADLKPAPPPSVETAKPAEPAEETKPDVDPLKEWGKELADLKTEIQRLKDQKTALQNEQTAINNKLFSPVTDSGAQMEAQAKTADLQKRMADNQKELTEAQSKLESLAGGPAKN